MAWTCVFSKQSLQPGLCGRSQLQEQVLSPAAAPLLPKLRGHFAEFLNHGSLDRLGILYLTTCVGLGYGPRCHSLEAFLGSIGSLTSPNRLGIGSQAHETRICLRLALRPYPGTTIARVQLPSCVTPSFAYYRFGSRAPPGSVRRHHQVSCAEHYRAQHGRNTTGTGISTRCPSTTPVGLALGPDLPRAD